MLTSSCINTQAYAVYAFTYIRTNEIQGVNGGTCKTNFREIFLNKKGNIRVEISLFGF